MDKQKQRIKIAEACGWYGIRETSHKWEVTDPPQSPMCIMGYHDKHGKQKLPDYLNDLNAMHEAIQTLSNRQLDDMHIELVNTMKGLDKFLWLLTPEQYAEAFLRTLNLWEE
jgi:hypothetical protein